ncbi:sporulation integral membrane protein YtvI [Peribacillus kribbensis]|uniref:sporulation integral membrane protein YtvI n=1 Tax=Peribacillus kribbensis TaxID=356658 RepID=UPI0004078B18|nr:sporulation integral membrane protein YtvI [Peribacillus kribbensis]
MNSVLMGRFIRFGITAGIIIGAALAGIFLWRYIYPFVIAFFAAFLMNPLVGFLQEKARLPRALAVLISICGILGMIAGILTLMITEIISGFYYLAAEIPQHIASAAQYLEQLIASYVIPQYNKLSLYFDSLNPGQKDTVMDNVRLAGNKMADSAGEFIQSTFQGIPAVLGWFPNAAAVFAILFMATFFISKDWYKLSSAASRFLPHKANTSGRRVFFDLKKAFFGFIKAQLTLISMTTVIVLAGLLFLRVEYAITIALLCGMVDILPYLGTGTIFVPWIFYEAIVDKDPGIALGLGILYLIVLLQRQIMEPKVLSSSIGLDPLATLAALFIGFKSIGFPGLIVGPVVLVILTTLHRAGVFHDIWTYIKGNDV